MTLSSENIVSCIKSLKDKQPCDVVPVVGLLLPVADRKLSDRYRGVGRPRKIDYDYEKIDWYVG